MHFIMHYKKWCDPADMYIMGQRQSTEVDNILFRTVVEDLGCNFIDWAGDYSTEDIKKDHARRTKELFTWDGWHFNVDSDEFFDRNINVPGLCANCDDRAKLFVRTRMTDRIAADGTFPEIGLTWCEEIGFMLDRDIYKIFPLEAEITTKLIGGYPMKDCLLKNPYYGHHNAWGVDLHTKRWPVTYKLHHFKWDSTCIDRMRYRSAPENQYRFPYWKDFKRFVDYYDKHGKIDIEKYSCTTT
jgi:hypothetical protein